MFCPKANGGKTFPKKDLSPEPPPPKTSTLVESPSPKSPSPKENAKRQTSLAFPTVSRAGRVAFAPVFVIAFPPASLTESFVPPPPLSLRALCPEAGSIRRFPLSSIRRNTAPASCLPYGLRIRYGQKPLNGEGPERGRILPERFQLHPPYFFIHNTTAPGISSSRGLLLCMETAASWLPERARLP